MKQANGDSHIPDQDSWFYLYQITCKTPGHIYVGITQKPEHRKQQHIRGKGARFTILNGVQKFTVLNRFKTIEEARDAENARTRQLDARGGVVRGGSWTSSVKTSSIRNLSISKPLLVPRSKRGWLPPRKFASDYPPYDTWK